MKNGSTVPQEFFRKVKELLAAVASNYCDCFFNHLRVHFSAINKSKNEISKELSLSFYITDKIRANSLPRKYVTCSIYSGNGHCYNYPALYAFNGLMLGRLGTVHNCRQLQFINLHGSFTEFLSTFFIQILYDSNEKEI